MKPKYTKVVFPNVDDAIEKLKAYCDDRGSELSSNSKNIGISSPSRW